MAWRCSGTTNTQLISNMCAAHIISNTTVANAMHTVDRAHYVRTPESAYDDSPQPIGHGATISAPHMVSPLSLSPLGVLASPGLRAQHAYAASELLPFLRPGARVLDVGSGSGYLVAVFHHLVGPTGTVVGVEHVHELAQWSKENLRRDGLGNALDEGRIVIVTGDGRQGYASGGPYDAIHVGAAAPTTPSKLVEQLASPGRMFIPVGNYIQHVLHVDKDKDGTVTETKVMGVSVSVRPVDGFGEAETE
ncbi:hypothetical protein C0992_008739 [Termitomyces sp. T32_za158]|nr:hypothetical protein C0992_008739 [Termitomyces sp. T32_za158]